MKNIGHSHLKLKVLIRIHHIQFGGCIRSCFSTPKAQISENLVYIQYIVRTSVVLSIGNE